MKGNGDTDAVLRAVSGRPGSRPMPTLSRPGSESSFASAGRGERPAAGLSMCFPRDGMRVALALLLALSIGRIHSLIGLEAFRPALVLGILTLAYALFKPTQLNDDALLKTWPARVMAGLGLVACISIPFGISIGASGSFVLTVYAKVLLLGFLLIAAIRNARDLHGFVWVYVASCGALVAFGLFTDGGMGRHRSVGMYDANDLSLILLTGIPLAFAVYQSSSTFRAKTVPFLVIVGAAATIAGGSSRGGFLGLVILGLALFALVNRVSLLKRVGLIVVLAVTLVVTAPEGYWNRMETTVSNPTEDYNWNTTYGRRKIWIRGVGYMTSNPLTGIGIDNFGRAEAIYAPAQENINPRVIGVRTKWSAAHNSFIQIGAEMGFPGLTLFTLIVFGGMFSMFRLNRRLPEKWARGDRETRFLYCLTRYLPVSFLGFAVSGFFLSYAYLDPLYVLAAFVAGTYASVTSRIRRERKAAQEPRSQRGVRYGSTAWRHRLLRPRA